MKTSKWRLLLALPLLTVPLVGFTWADVPGKYEDPAAYFTELQQSDTTPQTYTVPDTIVSNPIPSIRATGYVVEVEVDNSIPALQEYAGEALSGDEEQLECLVTLWNRESGWNYEAINPAFAPSDEPTPANQAYGIPQSGPGAKMAEFGEDWETNPRTQIDWGLSYINQVYGTPCAALSHSDATNWY